MIDDLVLASVIGFWLALLIWAASGAILWLVVTAVAGWFSKKGP